MNSTGRRIAILAVSLMFAASSAGLLFTAALAQETPESPTDPAFTTQSAQLESSDSGGSTEAPIPEDSDPASEIPSESTPSTDPQTTPVSDITDSNPPSSETLASDSDSPNTDPPETPASSDPDQTSPSTTQIGTESEATTSKATKAPSADPVLSVGAAMSQGPIPLSTDGESTAAEFVSGERPGQSADRPGNPTVPGATGSGSEVSGPSGSSADSGAGIRSVTVLCSLFAALSGAVLVLLKFIR